MRRRVLLSIAVALAALAPAASGQESSATAQAAIGASIVSGVSLQKAQDLIVGEFRPGQTFGTVDINVAESNRGVASSRSASGGVALAGNAFSAAQFSVTGPPGGPVHFNVVLPSSIRIQRIGGSETMTVDRFRSNVAGNCTSGAPEGRCPESPYTLMVGATLHVDPNQTAGRYVGTFTVTVNQL